MPHPPVVLRMALACWLSDHTHGLADAQEQWLHAHLSDCTWVPTATERAALKGPLLAWITERMPGVSAIVADQFREE